jgi:VanZ family protein
MIRNKPEFLNIFLKNHIPWIAWGVLIIVLVSIPDKQLPVISESVDQFQPDKLVHVVLFMVFVFLLQRGFDIPDASGNTLKSFYFATVLAGIILSGGTEIYQHFLIPGRNATLKDFLFNTLGSILGWIGYMIYRWKAKG